ncbi:MAG TPA: hypothetical protein VN822_05965 [Candidatus Acidoferrales bacterium]|nr:hypothetical protein [Candidatus Acidoferrales bacterium]
MTAFAVTTPLLAQSFAANSGDEIQQRARRLGTGDTDDLADAEELAQTPYESMGALIAELHTIPHPERAKLVQDTDAVEHMISVIAALRYITGGNDFYITGGRDFCAATEWKFGRSHEEDSRRYWLYFNNQKCVTFFAIWPSRYRVYLAPLDAQQKIISQWRRWYAEDGKSYRYKAPPESREENSLLWQCARGVYAPPKDTH